MSTQDTWKPSKPLAVILGLTLQQFAFLYVNKATLFWTYLLIALAIGFASITVGNNTVLKQWIESGYITVAFAFTCSVHAFYQQKITEMKLDVGMQHGGWCLLLRSHFSR